MAKKKVGYIELHWRCPNCGGLNRGRDSFCVACGSPQPEDVEFEQIENAELIREKELIARAEAGADIHCAYCGTRNPATATQCSQCGSELAEGIRRKAGRVLGAYQPGAAAEVACPACGASNPATAANCAQCGAPLGLSRPQGQVDATEAAQGEKRARKFSPAFIIIGGLVCLAVIVFFVLAGRTSTVPGVVEEVTWERSIAIETYQAVSRSDWFDQLPAEAENVSCEARVRSVESEPVPGAEEVCGTPYTVDKGSGFAEVVQDCEYQVYDDYCSYTVMDWVETDTAVASGHDFNPQWPEPALEADQRLGESRRESFSVVFAADGETYTYAPDTLEEFRQFSPGSRWNLEVNTFGVVVDVQP